jgi:hypothetical protein
LTRYKLLAFYDDMEWVCKNCTEGMSEQDSSSEESLIESESDSDEIEEIYA